MNWRILLRLFVLSLIGSTVGYVLVGELGVLIIGGLPALIASATFGTLLSGVFNSILLALIFTYVLYMRLASGAGMDLRLILMLALGNGAISFVFGLLSGLGLFANIIGSWQSFAMVVAAFFVVSRFA